MEYRGRHVRFPIGPGTEIDKISDAYAAAIRAGDEERIEYWRNEVYRVTGPYILRTRRTGNWTRHFGEQRRCRYRDRSTSTPHSILVQDYETQSHLSEGD